MIAPFLCFPSGLSDLSEQIKAATKDNHVRAENTQLMLSYQKGEITLVQYKVKCAQWLDTHKPLSVPFLFFSYKWMSIFMRLLGPAVLPLRDLQGSGR